MRIEDIEDIKYVDLDGGFRVYGTFRRVAHARYRPPGYELTLQCGHLITVCPPEPRVGSASPCWQCSPHYEETR